MLFLWPSGSSIVMSVFVLSAFMIFAEIYINSFSFGIGLINVTSRGYIMNNINRKHMNAVNLYLFKYIFIGFITYINETYLYL